GHARIRPPAHRREGAFRERAAARLPGGPGCAYIAHMAHPWHDIALPESDGFIPRTLAEDGDPLDVLVLGQEPVVPLCIVDARAIGGFRMVDEKGIDDKILCVHVNDPAFRDYQNARELPQHLVAEMKRFFEDYKALEGKDSAVGEQLSIAQ